MNGANGLSTQTHTLTVHIQQANTHTHIHTVHTLTQYTDSTHGKHYQPHGRWSCKFIIYLYTVCIKLTA